MGHGEIVQLRVAENAPRSAGRAGLCIGGRQVAAVAAQGLHATIIGPSGRRAKTRFVLELAS